MLLNRRKFAAVSLAVAARARAGASDPLGEALKESATRRRIPAVAAAVGTSGGMVWNGAYGVRDRKSGIAVKPDSIFPIASMTKAITTTAVLQLVERNKVALHEPLTKFLPEFAHLNVITGFDSHGKPIFQPAVKPVTLHHLLTHTSGFAYGFCNGEISRYGKYLASLPKQKGVEPPEPLVFEPGTRWQYGTSLDWAGRLVEKFSGLNLEQYFQRNILQPLDMKDTSFILPPDKFDRLVSGWSREPGGGLKENPRKQPAPPNSYGGGGGLYSTPPDYVKFMQMILRKGRAPGGNPVLAEKTVALMRTSQIGDLNAGRLTSYDKSTSRDVDLHPGFNDKWGYGFLINTVAYPGGRSAGSLAWAGIQNTFYWIDPARDLCATVMMRYLPFVDEQAVGLLGDFEKAVYANVKER